MNEGSLGLLLLLNKRWRCRLYHLLTCDRLLEQQWSTKNHRSGCSCSSNHPCNLLCGGHTCQRTKKGFTSVNYNQCSLGQVVVIPTPPHIGFLTRLVAGHHASFQGKCCCSSCSCSNAHTSMTKEGQRHCVVEGKRKKRSVTRDL